MRKNCAGVNKIYTTAQSVILPGASYGGYEESWGRRGYEGSWGRRDFSAMCVLSADVPSNSSAMCALTAAVPGNGRELNR